MEWSCCDGYLVDYIFTVREADDDLTVSIMHFFAVMCLIATI